jgi:hypothetical protein
MKAITPTKYELSEENGRYVLRAFSPDLPHGYTVIEAVRIVTGKSLNGFRKHGASRAKYFKVPFIDRTAH